MWLCSAQLVYTYVSRGDKAQWTTKEGGEHTLGAGPSALAIIRQGQLCFCYLRHFRLSAINRMVRQSSRVETQVQVWKMLQLLLLTASLTCSAPAASPPSPAWSQCHQACPAPQAAWEYVYLKIRFNVGGGAKG